MKHDSHSYSLQYALLVTCLFLSWSCVDSDADSPNLLDYGIEDAAGEGFGGEQDVEIPSGQEQSGIEMEVGGEESIIFELPNEVTVATYNVQNLFDFINDPEHDEGEYTPNVGQWSRQTYEARLRAIASALKIIDADVVTLYFDD